MAGIERAGKEDEAVRPALHHAMVEAEDRAIVGHLLDPEEGLLHVGWLVLGEVDQAAIHSGAACCRSREASAAARSSSAGSDTSPSRW